VILFFNTLQTKHKRQERGKERKEKEKNKKKGGERRRRKKVEYNLKQEHFYTHYTSSKILGVTSLSGVHYHDHPSIPTFPTLPHIASFISSSPFS